MLTVLRLFLLRWLAARTLGGVVAGALGAALPLAVLLKFIGIPLLAVAGLVGAPVGVVLAVLRLPLRIVLGAVGFVGALAAGAVAVGVAALKLALLVTAVVLVAGWLRRRARGPIAPAVVTHRTHRGPAPRT